MIRHPPSSTLFPYPPPSRPPQSTQAPPRPPARSPTNRAHASRPSRPTPFCLREQLAVRGRSQDLGESRRQQRSEEHTSELQSRSDLVCRLLLEKKKKRLCDMAASHFRADMDILIRHTLTSPLTKTVTCPSVLHNDTVDVSQLYISSE